MKGRRSKASRAVGASGTIMYEFGDVHPIARPWTQDAHGVTARAAGGRQSQVGQVEQVGLCDSAGPPFIGWPCKYSKGFARLRDSCRSAIKNIAFLITFYKWPCKTAVCSTTFYKCPCKTLGFCSLSMGGHVKHAAFADFL